ncbi:MAG: hypothetical protein ABFR97_01210 [Thermodesulfobacteriota bacterium]
MVNERVRTKERDKSHIIEDGNVETEINNVALGAISAFGIIIGLWSAAALVSAMVQVGGPFKLIASWFTAVGGM